MSGRFEALKPAIRRQGPDTGQARREILMLHGAWHGAWCLQSLAEGLTQAGYGVNLLDLPGHGLDKTSLPAGTSLKDYAEVAARAAASLDRPVIVAHSMGGWIAQKVLENGDLPAALITPLPGGGLPFLRLLNFFRLYPLKMTGLFFGRPLRITSPGMARRLFFKDLPDDQVAAHLEMLVPEPSRVGLEMGLGLARARPPMGREPRLIIAAEDDFFFPPRSMRKLAVKLGASIRTINDAPHNVWLEDPEGQVLGVLLDFIKGLE